MSDTVLEVKNLRKAFADVVAVNDVSFQIQKGEIFALLGPNGAGKTTTISAISRKVKKDSGEILIKGQPPEQNPELLHDLGVSTQELQLWPWLSCYDQLLCMARMYGVPGHEAKIRAEKLINLVQLQEKKRTITRQLSGGMQRRLHLILSMVHEPEILILDEPEAGLDPQSKVLVREFIQTLAGKKTILLTTHNMDEAQRLATRVAIMDHGKILELDTPDGLRKKIAPEETLELLYDKPVQLSKNMDNDRYRVVAKDSSVLVTGKSLMALVPEIIQKLTAAVGAPANFKFSQSTLEDVFIKLTGRSLRQ